MDYHEFLFESHVDHTNSLLKHLYDTKSFADVTLVCQDNFKLQAHKFILSSFSEVFELTLKMVNDVVNIPKVRKEEMLLILQFMYIGKVEVPKKNIVEFSQAVRELKVKFINDESLNIFVEEHVKEVKKKVFKEMKELLEQNLKKVKELPDQDVKEVKVKELQDEHVKDIKVKELLEEQFKEVKEKELQVEHVKEVKEKTSTKKKRGPRSHTSWRCKECDLPLHREASYNAHMDTVHHKTKWKCLDCDITFKSQSAFNYHRDSVHIRLKHPCPQCSQVMASKSNLTLHIKAKHMKIEYPCKQCSYKGTQASSLRRHMILKHTVAKHDKLVEKYW